MVLCKHFQQGYCRFGSKCNNEHIDIKQLVKTDVEGAINGKQYLFSCYGPFKDKPCIPNFIEDQSFEEMRVICYEAKQQNRFEQFHQMTRQAAADALNKMKALIQPSYELMNVLNMIYDSSESTTNAGNTTNANSNPFGLSSNTNTNAGSIFGKSSLNQTSNNNAFGGGAGNLFGGGNMANNTQTSSNIFGGQTQQPQQQQQTIQTSIFGQTNQQVQPSIFGGSSLTKPSVFGQQQQQQPVAQNNTGSGFGLFGQTSNVQNPSVFGQPPSFGQTQQMQAQQQSGGSIFGQNAFGNQAANVNPFGQAQAQQQQPHMFSQVAPMISQQQPQQQQPGAMDSNIFGQAAAQTQQQQPGGFFQQTGGAALPIGNMQQQPQQMQPFAQMQQQPANMQQQPPNMQQQPVNMQQQQPGTLPIAAQPTAISLPQNLNRISSTEIYSRMEDLTAEEIAAFKAEIFEPGKLPFVPPPMELING